MITSTYRPYPEYQTHKNIDKTRSRFANALTYLFFEMLSFGSELSTLERIGKNTGYSASATLKDCVKQSMRTECNSSGDKHQFRVKIKGRKLSDLLNNYLDGNVISESRRRNQTRTPELLFVGELLNLEYDIEVSFHFNREENRVSFIKTHRPLRTNETWLEKILLRAVNAMDDSIVFTDLGGDHDNG
jgi:hypothetical protein